jgi:hypothetical protein
MARVILQAKEETLKIKQYEKGDSHYIPTNDPENFILLKDNRHEDEKFTRVDRYMINHYYLVGTEWLMERIFYPSSYGLEGIENDNYPPLIAMRDKLINEGIGLYGDRPIPNIEKPVKRLELECKPKKMRLECKD